VQLLAAAPHHRVTSEVGLQTRADPCKTRAKPVQARVSFASVGARKNVLDYEGNRRPTLLAKTEISDRLTNKQQRFVEEYIVDLNATQAAIRAGYAPHTAPEQASRLLTNVKVGAAIEAARGKQAERTAIRADAVLRRWWDIATADPNELIQHRRAPCRYCNGKSHAYQWKTRREFDAACAAAMAAKETPPSDEGGYGYLPTAPIDPACPECGGEGVGYVLAVDTRNLTPQARLLYAGTKQTKDGLEIKLHDQGKALENVARHLGMFVDKMDVNHKLTLEMVVSAAMQIRVPAPPKALLNE